MRGRYIFIWTSKTVNINVKVCATCHMTMTKEKSNFFCVSVHISACHVCVLRAMYKNDFLLWSTRLFTDVCFLQSLLQVVFSWFFSSASIPIHWLGTIYLLFLNRPMLSQTNVIEGILWIFSQDLSLNVRPVPMLCYIVKRHVGVFSHLNDTMPCLNGISFVILRLGLHHCQPVVCWPWFLLVLCSPWSLVRCCFALHFDIVRPNATPLCKTMRLRSILLC